MARPVTQLSPTTGLLALVDELLLAIIDQIDSHSSLCKLATTCSRFQGLVEPYVWRKLFITNGDHAREIAYALDSREARPSYVHDLSIRYPKHRSLGIGELNHAIGLMDKLRHLTIESPCPNNNDWHSVYFDEPTKIDYRALLEAAVLPRPGLSPALPMLQSLTLHGHGPDDKKFVFGRSAVMFFHPTLRHITLSCTNFDADITHNKIPQEKKKNTPLQSLTLIECNVNVKFLDVVLSLPKALKELHISERQHVFAECQPSHDATTRTSHPLFLDALFQQADSLERLTHTSGHIDYIDHQKTGKGKMCNLTNLQYLELGAESVLIAYLEQNDYPDSLRILKVTDAAWSSQLRTHEQVLRHPGALLRKCLDLVTSKMTRPVDLDIRFNSAESELVLSTLAGDNLSLILSIILGYPVRRPVYQLATALTSQDKRLRIFSQKFSGGNSYIPPYMYGEEAPHEVQLYDSDDFWRFAGRNYKVLDDDEYRAEVLKNSQLTCVGCAEEGRVCFNSGDGKAACIHCEAGLQDCVYEMGETSREDPLFHTVP